MPSERKKEGMFEQLIRGLQFINWSECMHWLIYSCVHMVIHLYQGECKTTEGIKIHTQNESSYRGEENMEQADWI